MERFRILEPSQLSHSPSSGVCRVLTVGTVGDVERAQLAHFRSHPSAAKSWLHGCHYCFQHPLEHPVSTSKQQHTLRSTQRLRTPPFRSSANHCLTNAIPAYFATKLHVSLTELRLCRTSCRPSFLTVW